MTPPPRGGRVGFEIRSRLANHRVDAELRLPAGGMPVPTTLRLRAPESHVLRSVHVDGREIHDYSPQQETVTLSPGSAGTLLVEATYGRP